MTGNRDIVIVSNNSININYNVFTKNIFEGYKLKSIKKMKYKSILKISISNNRLYYNNRRIYYDIVLDINTTNIII